MRIEKCYFCSGPIYPGHGMMFVRNDCKVFRFCKSKCHKNFKKKRNPRKVRWTKAFRKAAGKELTVDNSFEFEKRRNEPVRYQRELWNKTIDAMKRVEEIKQKRQAKFIMNRLKKNKELQKVQDIKEVKQNIHLIRAPLADAIPASFQMSPFSWKRLAILILGRRPTTSGFRWNSSLFALRSGCLFPKPKMPKIPVS
ncbi:probable ribosome biogenesis protein RLP24 isoform X1 [Physeter macrocephalus]|uniref:Probable ribosome biogenesis protein RLP24 n=1 Tax=Physeter macrocephalus TaxID=9755 RepID=A0A2Y9T1A6_PHYMC|nr:probable ribosome biogenesis protein RLP24 isoform X1 [Physeter catodon]